MMNQKILLAEDDNDMRRFLVKALEKAGYKVSSFDTGASAYDRLREEPFSLLLTDIVMPELDGIALSLKAAKDYPDMKILMMSGYANQRQRAHNLDFLAHEVISKPFSLDEITNRVRDTLRRAG